MSNKWSTLDVLIGPVMEDQDEDDEDFRPDDDERSPMKNNVEEGRDSSEDMISLRTRTKNPMKHIQLEDLLSILPDEDLLFSKPKKNGMQKKPQNVDKMKGEIGEIDFFDEDYKRFLYGEDILDNADDDDDEEYVDEGDGENTDPEEYRPGRVSKKEVRQLIRDRRVAQNETQSSGIKDLPVTLDSEMPPLNLFQEEPKNTVSTPKVKLSEAQLLEIRKQAQQCMQMALQNVVITNAFVKEYKGKQLKQALQTRLDKCYPMMIKAEVSMSQNLSNFLQQVYSLKAEGADLLKSQLMKKFKENGCKIPCNMTEMSQIYGEYMDFNLKPKCFLSVDKVIRRLLFTTAELDLLILSLNDYGIGGTKNNNPTAIDWESIQKFYLPTKPVGALKIKLKNLKGRILDNSMKLQLKQVRNNRKEHSQKCIEGVKEYVEKLKKFKPDLSANSRHDKGTAYIRIKPKKEKPLKRSKEAKKGQGLSAVATPICLPTMQIMPKPSQKRSSRRPTSRPKPSSSLQPFLMSGSGLGPLPTATATAVAMPTPPVAFTMQTQRASASSSAGRAASPFFQNAQSLTLYARPLIATPSQPPASNIPLASQVTPPFQGFMDHHSTHKPAVVPFGQNQKKGCIAPKESQHLGPYQNFMGTKDEFPTVIEMSGSSALPPDESSTLGSAMRNASSNKSVSNATPNVNGISTADNLNLPKQGNSLSSGNMTAVLDESTSLFASAVAKARRKQANRPHIQNRSNAIDPYLSAACKKNTSHGHRTKGQNEDCNFNQAPKGCNFNQAPTDFSMLQIPRATVSHTLGQARAMEYSTLKSPDKSRSNRLPSRGKGLSVFLASSPKIIAEGSRSNEIVPSENSQLFASALRRARKKKSMKSNDIAGAVAVAEPILATTEKKGTQGQSCRSEQSTEIKRKRCIQDSPLVISRRAPRRTRRRDQASPALGKQGTCGASAHLNKNEEYESGSTEQPTSCIPNPNSNSSHGMSKLNHLLIGTHAEDGGLKEDRHSTSRQSVLREDAKADISSQNFTVEIHQPENDGRSQDIIPAAEERSKNFMSQIMSPCRSQTFDRSRLFRDDTKHDDAIPSLDSRSSTGNFKSFLKSPAKTPSRVPLHKRNGNITTKAIASPSLKLIPRHCKTTRKSSDANLEASSLQAQYRATFTASSMSGDKKVYIGDDIYSSHPISNPKDTADNTKIVQLPSSSKQGERTTSKTFFGIGHRIPMMHKKNIIPDIEDDITTKELMRKMHQEEEDFITGPNTPDALARKSNKEEKHREVAACSSEKNTKRIEELLYLGAGEDKRRCMDYLNTKTKSGLDPKHEARRHHVYGSKLLQVQKNSPTKVTGLKAQIASQTSGRYHALTKDLEKIETAPPPPLFGDRIHTSNSRSAEMPIDKLIGASGKDSKRNRSDCDPEKDTQEDLDMHSMRPEVVADMFSVNRNSLSSRASKLSNASTSPPIGDALSSNNADNSPNANDKSAQALGSRESDRKKRKKYIQKSLETITVVRKFKAAESSLSASSAEDKKGSAKIGTGSNRSASEIKDVEAKGKSPWTRKEDKALLALARKYGAPSKWDKKTEEANFVLACRTIEEVTSRLQKLIQLSKKRKREANAPNNTAKVKTTAVI